MAMKHFPFPIVNKDQANCLDCYRCLRKCPMDAIEFSSGRARIITESCVVCGQCVKECPQHTKRLISDMDFVVKALTEKKQLILSLGEGVLLSSKMTVLELAHKAYDVGFDFIEEADVLEEEVMGEFEDYIRGSDKMVLSSHCPVIVNLVEQHYPEWIENLLPLPSLASIHARDLKKRFPNHMLVHASTCPAEFYNRQNDENIDYLITLSELDRILRFTPTCRDHTEAKGYYEESVGGYAFSIVGNMSTKLIEDGVVDKSDIEWYSGLNTCINILSQRNDKLLNEVQFLELMACNSGCINSIDVHHPESVFGRCLLIKRYNSDRIYLPRQALSTDISEIQFEERKYQVPQTDVAAIKAEMDECFTNSDAKILNCGACGYNTCYAKSAAVVRGEADREMCMSYMKAKAESFANVVVNNIESGIVVFDKDYTILQLNPYVKRMFTPYPLEVGKKLSDFLDVHYMKKTVETGEVVHNLSIAYKELELWTQQTIQPLDGSESHFVAFFVDVTERERQREQFNNVKRDLLINANQVIDDQMRVAQEIASLLGETTVATKITLLKLINEFQREKELK